FAEDDVPGEVLHRRVERLLDEAVETVDLIDEEDVARLEARQGRGEVPRNRDRRTGRDFDIGVHLVGDDRGQSRLAEAGRAVEKYVVERLAALPRRLNEDVQVLFDPFLADVVFEALGSQRQVELLIAALATRADEPIHGLP